MTTNPDMHDTQCPPWCFHLYHRSPEYTVGAQVSVALYQELKPDSALGIQFVAHSEENEKGLYVQVEVELADAAPLLAFTKKLDAAIVYTERCPDWCGNGPECEFAGIHRALPPGGDEVCTVETTAGDSVTLTATGILTLTNAPCGDGQLRSFTDRLVVELTGQQVQILYHNLLGLDRASRETND